MQLIAVVVWRASRVNLLSSTVSLHFFCQTAADAVKSGRPIHLSADNLTLYEFELAVKTTKTLNVVFYTVFQLSIYDQEKFY